MNMLEHTMLGIDRILNGSPTSTGTARKSYVTSQSQEDVPHAGLGPVETGTSKLAALVLSQRRQSIYEYERLIEQLYDLARADRWDELHDLVRQAYLGIHGE